MNHIKNYAWAEAFNIPEKHFKSWKEKNNGESFLSWALTERVIDRKKYFEWATIFYNIPSVQNIFFEQNLMNYKQWNKTKHLQKWHQMLLPIYLWEDTVFVGCLETPQNHKSWTFKYRLVLTTDLALRMHWKYLKDFKKLINEPKNTSTPSSLNEKLSLPEPNYDRPGSETTKVKKILSKKSYPKEEIILNSKTSSTKLHLVSMDTKTNVDSKEEAPKTTPLSEKTNLINIGIKTNVDSKEVTLKTTPSLEKTNSTKHETETNTDSSVGELTKNACFTIQAKENYTEFFDQLKSNFVASLVLQNKDNDLFPVNWSGRINTNLKTTKKVSNLKGLSIFKVIGKGHAYHGFVVDTKDNRHFFDSIGWPQYPQHITAIPIKNQKNQLDFVFIGIALNNLDRKSIQKIEQKVLDYFSNSIYNKLAA